MRQLIVAAIMVAAATECPGQVAPPATTGQSQMTRILQSSGSLILREYHLLPGLSDFEGKSFIACRAIVARNQAVVGAPSDWTTAVALQLSTLDTQYGPSAYLDPDEVNGLLAALELVQSRGEELLQPPLASLGEGDMVSRDLTFTTKDNLSLRWGIKRGIFFHAVRLTLTSEWAYLDEPSLKSLKANLLATQQLAAEAMGD